MHAPIFIVGAPRSGTTLLRNMLNRHPAIAICLETQFLRLIYARRKAFGDLSQLHNRRRLVREYLSTARVKAMRMDMSGLEAALLRDGASYRSFFAALLRFHAQAQGKRRCGEKSPEHGLCSDTLSDWFPDALILHVLRDPRDVVASLLRLDGKPNSVLANAHTWQQCNLRAAQSRGRLRYLTVRYESLVVHPEQELRAVCDCIGEEFSPAMLVPDKAESECPPWLQRASQPLTTDRMQQWREQLTPDEVSLIEWKIGPHMQTFGYKPVSSSPSRWAIGAAFAGSAFDAVRRGMVEFPAAFYALTGSANIVKEEAARRRVRRHLTHPADS